MTEQEYTEQISKALDWIKKLPSDETMVDGLTMIFMHGRNAVDESSAVPEEEMSHFVNHVNETMSRLRFLSLMARGSLIANFSEGEPKFCLSEQGVQEARSVRQ